MLFSSRRAFLKTVEFDDRQARVLRPGEQAVDREDLDAREARGAGAHVDLGESGGGGLRLRLPRRGAQRDEQPAQRLLALDHRFQLVDEIDADGSPSSTRALNRTVAETRGGVLYTWCAPECDQRGNS